AAPGAGHRLRRRAAEAAGHRGDRRAHSLHADHAGRDPGLLQLGAEDRDPAGGRAELIPAPATDAVAFRCPFGGDASSLVSQIDVWLEPGRVQSAVHVLAAKWLK